MGLTSGDLPLEVDAALLEIGQFEPGSYQDLIQRAVFAFRDELLAHTSCVHATVYLGDIGVVAAVPPGEAPRVMLTGRLVEVDLVCAGKTPTATAVDAMERIAEAVCDARDLLRTAFRQATVTRDQPRREVNIMTGMDDGPSGPGLPVPDEPTPTTPDPAPDAGR